MPEDAIVYITITGKKGGGVKYMIEVSASPEAELVEIDNTLPFDVAIKKAKEICYE